MRTRDSDVITFQNLRAKVPAAGSELRYYLAEESICHRARPRRILGRCRHKGALSTFQFDREDHDPDEGAISSVDIRANHRV